MGQPETRNSRRFGDRTDIADGVPLAFAETFFLVCYIIFVCRTADQRTVRRNIGAINICSSTKVGITMHERLLTDFQLISTANNTVVLRNDLDYNYTLALATGAVLRLTLTGPERRLSPHDNLIFKLPEHPPVLNSLKVNQSEKTLMFSLIDGKVVTLTWKKDIVLTVHETLDQLPQDDPRRNRLVYSTVPGRGYLLNEHGVTRYNKLVVGGIYLGLGEKAAPVGE